MIKWSSLSIGSDEVECCVVEELQLSLNIRKGEDGLWEPKIIHGGFVLWAGKKSKSAEIAKKRVVSETTQMLRRAQRLFK